MKPFAELLDRLLYTPQRNVKLALMLDYFRRVPDPDRGYGLAALTGALSFANAKPALVRDLAMTRSDPVLFGWSYDFVGDLAETTALIWPERPTDRRWPELKEVIQTLHTAPKAALPGILAGWLDTLDATGRWALLKLVTGALRVGASARLAKTALAEYGKVDVAEIEEVWHGLEPPYAALFAWLDGQGPRPSPDGLPAFRPLMLAHPIEVEDLAKLEAEPEAWAAEWKWDGIRVQVASTGQDVRIYSRTGDEISRTFPDIATNVAFRGRGRRRAAGRQSRRARQLQRAAAAPQPQGADGRHARGFPGLRPALRPAARGRGGPAAVAVHPAPRPARGVHRPRAAAAHGPVAADPVQRVRPSSRRCGWVLAPRRSRG